MHAEDFFVNYGRNGQTVETICESFPKFDIVTTLTFIVEPVDTVDRCALMVASENEEVFWVFDLVCQQQTYGLQGLFPTIHVVT